MLTFHLEFCAEITSMMLAAAALAQARDTSIEWKGAVLLG